MELLDPTLRTPRSALSRRARSQIRLGVSTKMGINFYFVSCGSVFDSFATQDPSSENQSWVDLGELGIEFGSLRELIAAIYKDLGANSI